MPSNAVCSCFLCCLAAPLTFLEVDLLLPVLPRGADWVEGGKWGVKPTLGAAAQEGAVAAAAPRRKISPAALFFLPLP